MDIEEKLIIFTYHSLDRLSIRNITKQMVRAALTNPDKTGLGYNNRQLVFKKFGNKTIKVIYAREDEKYIIISVLWEE